MNKLDKSEGGFWKRSKGIILIGVLIIAIITATFWSLFAMNSWATVPQGYAMLIVDATKPDVQKVSEPILGAAAGFYLDGFKKIIGQQYAVLIYYATDTYEDTIPCFSSDQLEMAITVQMRWQLNISKLRALYRSYPKLDYEQTAIDSIMEETIRLVTKNYTALETVEFRENVAEQMQEQVFKKIAEDPSLEGALSYLRFDLKNIGYPEQYTKAIEEKLVKEQLKLGAEFERQRILILANATAQEIILKSEGEAQAKIIIANSTKQAIQMILEASGADPQNATRIAELYLWVETLKQIAPNIDKFFLFVGKEGVPIMVPIEP